MSEITEVVKAFFEPILDRAVANNSKEEEN